MNYLWLELIGSMCMFEFVQFIYFFTKESLCAFRSFTVFVHIYSFSFSSLVFSSSSFIIFFFTSSSPLLVLIFIDCYWIWLADCLWRFANSLVMCSLNSVFHSMPLFTALTPSLPQTLDNFFSISYDCVTGLFVWCASCAYVVNESNVAEVMRYLTRKELQNV